MELAEVVMNPAWQRIFQHFLVHDTVTVKTLLCRLDAEQVQPRRA